MSSHNSFDVLSVGWGPDLVEGVLEQVSVRAGLRFSHAVANSSGVSRLSSAAGRTIVLRPDIRAPMPRPDEVFLNSLEAAAGITLHNVILADPIVRRLPYDQVLGYATFLARRLEDQYGRLGPAAVLGSFDGILGGLAFMVARKVGLPWFTLHFTPLPKGLTAFCDGMNPSSCIAVREWPDTSLDQVAEDTLATFEEGRLRIPAYTGVSSLKTLVAKAPAHGRLLAATVRASLTGELDVYSNKPVLDLLKQYGRKRWNLATLPRRWMLDRPPQTPYLFFGLHTEPDSALDVWAPFAANQLAVVEAVARAMPPTHQLLVKMHKSDADGYSRQQLRQFLRLPGVRLVHPSANARDFVEQAAMVISIQGTIGLEAALLGKPVVTFGDGRLTAFPTVKQIRDWTELPGGIRSGFMRERPARSAIVQALAVYLRPFRPGCYNDWTVLPTRQEIDALSDLFVGLRDYVWARRRGKAQLPLGAPEAGEVEHR